MGVESERGPKVRYSRDSAAGIGSAGVAGAARDEDTFAQALDLARKLQELLEDTRSVAMVDDPCTHSTRMARAMAASLVDELEALVQPPRKTGSS